MDGKAFMNVPLHIFIATLVKVSQEKFSQKIELNLQKWEKFLL